MAELFKCGARVGEQCVIARRSEKGSASKQFFSFSDNNKTLNYDDCLCLHSNKGKGTKIDKSAALEERDWAEILLLFINGRLGWPNILSYYEYLRRLIE